MTVDNFDTEAFIEVIHQRPCLWDVTNDEYSNKTVKKQCWNQVFCAVVQGFEHLPQDVKEKKSFDLQRRWKSLRNSYSRELAKQKKLKKGSGALNRKQYVYFDMLSFLTGEPTTIVANSNYIEEEEKVCTVTVADKVREAVNAGKRNRKRESDSQDGLTESNEPVVNELLTHGSNLTDNDDDKLFLLSLHTHLKSVRQDQKLFVKSEMLQILAKYNSPTHFSYPVQNMLNSTQPSTFQNYQSPYQRPNNLPVHCNFQVIVPPQPPTNATSPINSVPDSEDSSN